jgi:hypothetical protein
MDASKTVQEIIQNADALDQRRQVQIQAQISSMNLLLGRLMAIRDVVRRPLGTTSLAGDNAERERRYHRVRELAYEGNDPGYKKITFALEEAGPKYTVDSATVQPNGELLMMLKPVK